MVRIQTVILSRLLSTFSCTKSARTYFHQPTQNIRYSSLLLTLKNYTTIGATNGYGASNTYGLRNNRELCNLSNFGDNNNSITDFKAKFSVHLRGMPYTCDEMDIMKFFEPLKPVHCKVIYNIAGRHTGKGIAYFDSHEEAYEALKLHRETMGSRYIELFYKNSTSDNNIGNPSGSTNSSNTDLKDKFSVHLRGMPYICDEMDIMKFFNPLKPVHCKVIYRRTGRHSGEGIAYFDSDEEAREALKRDKETMGSRYIELFYKNSTNDSKIGSLG